MKTLDRRTALRYLLPAACALAGLLAFVLRPSSGGAPAAPGTPPAARTASPVSAAAAAPRVDGGVTLPDRARDKNPVAVRAVEKVRLAPDLDLVGSATFDGDRYAMVGPLIAGRITALKARPGDAVRAGQVLAEIDSAEVGQAQAAYLSAAARANTSQANARRERDLHAQRVSSAREREVAEAQATSDAAELRAAEQRLLALGLGRSEIAAAAKGRARAGRLALRAPISGVVLQRSITVGQAVEAHTDAFRVADLGHLWVMLDVFEKDLEHVHVGQRAELRTESLPGVVLESRVAYVEPRIDEATRTARVRIEFENRGGRLRPGQFVTAHLSGSGTAAQGEPVVAVPRSAIVTIEGRPVVFVAGPGSAYSRRSVELGRSGGGLVEVRAGLAPGEQVVTDGAFLLKSELAR